MINEKHETSNQEEMRLFVTAEIGCLEKRINAESRQTLLDNLEAIGRIHRTGIRAGILFDNGEAIPSGLLLLREVCGEVIDAIDQIAANRERIARLRNAMLEGEEEE